MCVWRSEGTFCNRVHASLCSALPRVSETVVSIHPQTATLTVSVEARPWRTTLTQLPESAFAAPINRFEDTGRHDWTTPNYSVATGRIDSGPNRGCRFAESTTGLAFTSNPQINASVLDSAEHLSKCARPRHVLAPPAVR